MTKFQNAKAAIAAHALGRKYGNVAGAISDVFVGLVAESAEATWPGLLNDRLALLDGAGKPASRTLSAEPTVKRSLTEHAHARMAAAFRGEKFVPLEDCIAEAAEERARAEALAEARAEQRRSEDTAPADAHTTMAEAINGNDFGTGEDKAGTDAHQRMARAFGARR